MHIHTHINKYIYIQNIYPHTYKYMYTHTLIHTHNMPNTGAPYNEKKQKKMNSRLKRGKKGVLKSNVTLLICHYKYISEMLKVN